MIYLDHAAATPVDPLVVQSMLPYFSDKFFNPSSPYSAGVEVRRDYNEAKSQIARSIGVQADELIMTAGATESINIAASAAKGIIAVGNIEHAAVLAIAGDEGIIIPSNSRGFIEASTVEKNLTPDVSLVSIGLVNSELGTIQPITDIVKVIEQERTRRRQNNETTPLLVHCDASQGLALLDIKPKRLGIDMMTLSAAKVYGPKQVGLLWVRPGVEVKPTIVGGGQEMGIRSGTENVAGVVGFASAISLASRRRGSEVKRLTELRDKLQGRLEKEFPDMVVSSSRKSGLVSYLHVSFPGIDAERLIFLLEKNEVMVATGSACAANKGLQSHVLKAIGMSDDLINGSLRISLGRLSDEKNIDKAAQFITQAVKSEQVRIGQ